MKLERNKLRPSHSGNTSLFRRSSKWLSREKVFLLFQLNSNMLNILFAMGMFAYIKNGRNAQWEHLFLMYFDDFLTVCLTF